VGEGVGIDLAVERVNMEVKKKERMREMSR
jgi:hypothetical protein